MLFSWAANRGGMFPKTQKFFSGNFLDFILGFFFSPLRRLTLASLYERIEYTLMTDDIDDNAIMMMGLSHFRLEPEDILINVNFPDTVIVVLSVDHMYGSVYQVKMHWNYPDKQGVRTKTVKYDFNRDGFGITENWDVVRGGKKIRWWV